MRAMRVGATLLTDPMAVAANTQFCLLNKFLIC